MADLLAAASLLLTVVTILYSLWYPEINEALKLPIDDYPINNKEKHRKCRGLLISKLIPLSVAATMLFFINFPDTWKIVSDAVVQFQRFPLSHYSAVRAAFVVAEVVLAFLAVHTIWAAKMLGQHVSKLNPNK